MEVKEIQAEDTYLIRQKVLRNNGPIETCKFHGDKEENSFHLGAFVDGKLASVASFYFHQNPFLDGHYQFQLRGMATLPEYQKKGFSSALLKRAIPLLKKNQSEILWCNARQTALGFYQKLGFESFGEIFDIQPIGAHQIMFLRLN